jgi:hypothetical protein
MRKTAMAAVVSVAMIFQPAISFAQQRAPDAFLQQDLSDGEANRSKPTDFAIATLFIAGSVAICKSTGAPCACPGDVARNGSSCGGRSAWSKPGGAKPMCFEIDITADIIKAYRATKAIPVIW